MPTAGASQLESKPSFWAACSALLTPRDRANMRRFNIALAIWALVFLGSTALLRFGAVEGAAAWLVALAPATMAVIAIRHYVRFLRAADELLRLVQLEGLALGFGAGFVFMTSWRLFERAGAPHLDISDGLLVMIVFWTLGQFLAARRYS
jgi:hypothetical protein